jgi:hypothetical protein
LCGVFAFVLLIVGAIMGGFVGKGLFNKLHKQACKNSDKLFAEHVEAIDMALCTNDCPCTKGKNGEYEKYWTSLPQKTLRKYNRVGKVSDLKQYEKQDWNKNGDNADVLPLVFKNGDETFTSFYQCYMDVKKSKMEKYPEKRPKNVKDFFDKGGYGFMQEMEEKYDCASVCNVPLFYIARDISENKPEQECVKAIFDGISGSMKVEAAFCIILSLVLVVAMVSGLVICMGPKDKSKEDFDDIND